MRFGNEILGFFSLLLAIRNACLPVPSVRHELSQTSAIVKWIRKKLR
jgi:hypothetical protein